MIALRQSQQLLFLSLALSLLFVLSGCSLSWDDGQQRARKKSPDIHEVQAGESFYAIALRYNLDYKALAAWNGMNTRDVIFVGQKLKLYPPKKTSGTSRSGASSAASSSTNSSTTRSRDTLKLLWPLKGRLINRFNDQDKTIKGVDISGLAGQRIKAAAAGKVVYAGSGLVGLGNVIVLKHNETYLTAYGYNEKLLLTEGAEVKQGEDIAVIGTGMNNQLMLHFEVRKNGKPVNPLLYLPK